MLSNTLPNLLRIVQPFSFCLIQDSDYSDIAVRISVRRETLFYLQDTFSILTIVSVV